MDCKKHHVLKKILDSEKFGRERIFFGILTLVYLDSSDDPDSFEPPFREPFFFGEPLRAPFGAP